MRSLDPMSSLMHRCRSTHTPNWCALPECLNQNMQQYFPFDNALFVKSYRVQGGRI
jgi:hypothetical protein